MEYLEEKEIRRREDKYILASPFLSLYDIKISSLNFIFVSMNPRRPTDLGLVPTMWHCLVLTEDKEISYVDPNQSRGKLVVNR